MAQGVNKEAEGEGEGKEKGRGKGSGGRKSKLVGRRAEWEGKWGPEGPKMPDCAREKERERERAINW